MFNDLTPRIKRVAEFLITETNLLIELLKTNGITVLESNTTTIEDLVEILGSLEGKIHKLKIKTAAGILKGDSEEKKELTSNLCIVEELKKIHPIEQWSDENLLTRYIKDREIDVELELHRRAKQDRFIVLKPSDKGYNSGEEVIDFIESIGLLKGARKGKYKNPGILPVKGGVRPVYFITEFNINDRITELCSICSTPLYKSYCDHCQVNFIGIEDDCCYYMALVSEMDTFNKSSASDRKALVASAQKGMGSLKSEWHSLAQVFDELKATQQLPRIRVIASRPSKVDPFFQNGSRSVGP